MKKKLIYFSSLLLLAGFVFGSMFGLVFAACLAGAIGLAAGIYKKDKSVWKPFGSLLFLGLACIVVFIVLLENSNM